MLQVLWQRKWRARTSVTWTPPLLRLRLLTHFVTPRTEGHPASPDPAVAVRILRQVLPVMVRPESEIQGLRIRYSIPTRLRGDAMKRSEEHTSELQSHHDLVCRLLLEKK